mgnify:CR=1 FL=1
MVVMIRYQGINNRNPPLNVRPAEFFPGSYFSEISALESLLRGLIFQNFLVFLRAGSYFLDT